MTDCFIQRCPNTAAVTVTSRCCGSSAIGLCDWHNRRLFRETSEIQCQACGIVYPNAKASALIEAL